MLIAKDSVESDMTSSRLTCTAHGAAAMLKTDRWIKTLVLFNDKDGNVTDCQWRLGNVQFKNKDGTWKTEFRNEDGSKFCLDIEEARMHRYDWIPEGVAC